MPQTRHSECQILSVASRSQEKNSFVNGLKIGDDLTTIRPVSLGFNFLPFLEQTDAAGNELVPVVTQSEFGVVEMDGLSLNNGTLQKAVAGKLERQY